MLGDNSALTAYRRETAKRRNAARSPRFPGGSGGGSFGPSISRRDLKAMDALMGWAINSIPTEVKDSQRLI